MKIVFCFAFSIRRLNLDANDVLSSINNKDCTHSRLTSYDCFLHLDRTQKTETPIIFSELI